MTSRIEGTPNVALESMACAIPVIATDVSDNAKVIPDRIAGRIVALNADDEFIEAISELVLNPTLLRQLGLGARQWVEKEFTAAKLALKTKSVYMELLK